MSEVTHIVLIADIVRSRRYAQDARARIQERLIECVTSLNTGFSGSLASAAAVTTGDEFQLVLEDASVLTDVLWEIWRVMEGIPMRIGIGRGEIVGAIIGDPRLMDGAAFHQARAAISAARGLVAFRGFGDDGDAVLDGLGQALQELQRDFTRRDREVLGLLRGGLMQVEAARRVGVRPQAVSDVVRRAGWTAYRTAEVGLTAAVLLFAGRTKR